MSPKAKKITLIIAIVLVISVAILYLVWYKPMMDKKTLEGLSSGSASPSSGSTPPIMDPYAKYDKDYTRIATFSNSSPIKQGMMGDQIKQLQKYLNKNNNAGLTVDGVWGADTQDAFMKAKFIVPDNSSQIYSVLTPSLYNSLGLSSY